MDAIEREVSLGCSRRHAFQVFTSRVDLWWPRGHRRFEASKLTFEPFVGGRFQEQGAGGECVVLGEILVWEPPERLVYTWRPGTSSGHTQVEIHFLEQEDGRTRVVVCHRPGDHGSDQDWATRAQRFVQGWSVVLPAFQRHAELDDLVSGSLPRQQ
jgi:uncharacterized protein YndB with AHSA1/START domain